MNQALFQVGDIIGAPWSTYLYTVTDVLYSEDFGFEYHLASQGWVIGWIEQSALEEEGWYKVGRVTHG